LLRSIVEPGVVLPVITVVAVAADVALVAVGAAIAVVAVGAAIAVVAVGAATAVVAVGCTTVAVGSAPQAVSSIESTTITAIILNHFFAMSFLQ
jgi:hypothetical protein